MKRSYLLVVVLTLAFGASTGLADTLFYDGFDYSAPATGDENANELPSPWVTSQSGGDPVVTDGIDLADTGLSFGAMPVVGKAAYASNTTSRSERIGDFALPLNQNQTFYLSFLIRSPNISSSGWGDNGSGVSITDQGETYYDGFGAGIQSDADGTAGGGNGADYFFLSLGSRISRSDEDSKFFVATDLGQPQADTTYLMVAKFVFVNSDNTVDGYLKVYTDFADVPMDADPASWDLSVENLSLGWPISSDAHELDRVAVDRNNNINEVYMDEIRVGTTWGDTVVPEPTSLALLGLGSLVAVRRRRRA